MTLHHQSPDFSPRRRQSPETAGRSGLPKRRAGDYLAQERAERFQALPESVAHPKHLLEPVRSAGVLCPFDHTCLALLEILVDYTRIEDWRAGMPLCYPSNADLAAKLGCSPATLSRKLAALRASGAIFIRYGAGNSRFPMRDGRGRICGLDGTAPSGINLAPLYEFSLDLAKRVTALRSRQRAIMDKHKLAREHLEAIRAARDAAIGAGLDAPVLDSLHQIAANSQKDGDELFNACIPVLAPHLLPAEEPEADRQTRRIIALCEKIADGRRQADQIIEEAFRPITSCLEQEMISPLVTDDMDKTTSLIPIENRNAGQGSEEPEGEEQGDRLDHQPRSLDNRPRTSRVSPSRLLSLSPHLRRYCEDYAVDPDHLDLRQLQHAAYSLASRLGLSDQAWLHGLERHGPLQLALMTLVAVEKPAADIRNSRVALLVGMIKRSPAEIRPLPSLFGFAGRRETLRQETLRQETLRQETLH